MQVPEDCRKPPVLDARDVGRRAFKPGETEHPQAHTIIYLFEDICRRSTRVLRHSLMPVLLEPFVAGSSPVDYAGDDEQHHRQDLEPVSGSIQDGKETAHMDAEH